MENHEVGNLKEREEIERMKERERERARERIKEKERDRERKSDAQIFRQIVSKFSTFKQDKDRYSDKLIDAYPIILVKKRIAKELP